MIDVEKIRMSIILLAIVQFGTLLMIEFTLNQMKKLWKEMKEEKKCTD